jgi:hypothetical protein
MSDFKDPTENKYPKMIYRQEQKVHGGLDAQPLVEGTDYKIAKNEEDEEKIIEEFGHTKASSEKTNWPR